MSISVNILKLNANYIKDNYYNSLDWVKSDNFDFWDINIEVKSYVLNYITDTIIKVFVRAILVL